VILEIILENDSVTITIENPFHLDIDTLMKTIYRFAASKRISLSGLDMEGLIPKMVRGIAGCENGCPANAKSLVEQGYLSFTLKYIEGGILTAQASLSNGKSLQLKMFPEF